MKVVTAEQIRALDRRAIEEFGIPAAVLMENAGRAVVTALEKAFGGLAGRRIAVFCGGGNNGGDGFVVARYLHLAGAIPLVCMAGRVESLSGEAKTHYDLLAKLNLPFGKIELDEWRRVYAVQTDGIVDALLGTGIKDAPRGSIADAIEAINAAGIPTVAVDVPSGVDSDTGRTPGVAVRATHTVTFGYPKLGLFLFPGAERVGHLHVADIGFDWAALQPDTPYRWLRPEVRREERGKWGNGEMGFLPQPSALLSRETKPEGGWERLVKKRAAESNKGDYGHVAVVAGSRGMAGAPALVARAAQRSGAGLVTVLAPACAQPTIAAKLDEQMTLPLPDTDGAVSEAAFDVIAAFAEKATVLCVGPGLTTAPGAVALVQRLLTEIGKPIVLDADGLNALARNPDLIQARREDARAPLVLTPHPGEAARLLGTSIEDVQSNRIEAVRQLAARYRATVVLKGRYSLIAGPRGGVAINTTGNPGMATGGSGDTLTGILGGLLAQAVAPGKGIEDLDAYRAATVEPEAATELGVMLHGMAGDLAAAERGERGLVAGDLSERLPRAIRMLEERK